MIKTNKKVNIMLIVVGLFLAPMMLLFGLLQFTFTAIHQAHGFWWHGISTATQSVGTFITISTWDRDESEPVNFDDVIDALLRADPFLANGTRSVHIIGCDITDAAPIRPIVVMPYDVLVFAMGDSITAVKSVGVLPIGVFDSWVNLQAALNTNSVALTMQGAGHNAANVYTRQHAPVSFGGNRWLARHDNVTGIPMIGEDWFLVSNTWVNQYYPIGSITTHSGRQWRKTGTGLGEPGVAANWAEIPFVDREAFEVPIWYAASWGISDVVRHHGVFYVSTVAGNTTTPGLSPTWQIFTPFDATNTVPNWVSGTVYAVGDFVRVGSRYFVLSAAWGATAGPIGSTAWTEVHNYDHLSGIKPWDSGVTYTMTTHPSILVEHQGMIFQLTGHSPMGTEPQSEGSHWRRIMTWAETQRPTPFRLGDSMAGMYQPVRIFEVSGIANPGYYALIGLYWASATPNPATSDRFRRVDEWSPSRTYTSNHSPWGGGYAHVYTIDEATGQRIFWQATSLAVSGAANYPHDGSPHWSRFVFDTSGLDLVVTTVGGRPVVWDRNPSAACSPRPPSIMNNDWIRRAFPVTNPYVFTNYNGTITLWRNTNTAAPGNANLPGGDGWTLIPFRTGIEFVYTVNEAGIPHFWRSPTQSSTAPSMSNPAWTLLRYELFAQVPEVFFMFDDMGRVTHFEQRDDGTWLKLSNAWIGSFGVMVNRWNAHNNYRLGDIVVYGTTLTNTYRYFRIREGTNASLATGVSPMSPAGNVFWEPVR